MIIEKEWITPDRAQEMLRSNGSNRPIRHLAVKEYANAISAGRWQTTHQGIAISTDGEVIDGQHRLHAIILADKPVIMTVARGVSSDAYKVIDSGKSRSTGDRFGLSAIAAAPVKFLYQFATHSTEKHPDDIAPYMDVFSPIVVRLQQSTPSRRAQVSSRPVQAAACVLATEGHEFYAFNAYRNLVLLKMDEWQPALRSLYTQLLNTHLGVGRQRENAVFIRALIGFDIHQSHVQQIIVRKPANHLANARIRIKRLLSEQNK